LSSTNVTKTQDFGFWQLSPRLAFRLYFRADITQQFQLPS